MTNREITAVKGTLKQWEWYIENPEEQKDDYFTAHNLNEPDRFLCYLCSIWWDKDEHREHLACNKRCPLATRTLICDKSIAPNNPYDHWNHYEYFQRSLTKGERAERVRQAKRIVRACERWLKKHDKGKVK